MFKSLTICLSRCWSSYLSSQWKNGHVGDLYLARRKTRMVRLMFWFEILIDKFENYKAIS